MLVTLSDVCRAAESDAAGDGRYVIHLINVVPGGELFMRFGHIAVIVEDRKFETNAVYNFGTFDFQDPALKYRYARGFLNYWLSVIPLPPMIDFYHMLGRGVTIRTLDLSPEQSAEIARRLEINARPENATYAYRHYKDNCCTRIRDLLDDILDGAISAKYKDGPTGRSHRYWTYQALLGMPVMRTIILLIMGREIDKPVSRWDEEFLPEILAEDLDNLRVGPDQKPLIVNKRQLFPSRGPKIGEYTPPEEIIPFIVLFSLLILGFGLPIVLPKKKWTPRFAGIGLTVWGLLGGLGGLLMVLLWTATSHYDTHHNENVLTFPLLHLWLLGPGMKLIFKGRVSEKTARILNWYFIGALGLIALDLLLKIAPGRQSNYEFIAFSAACNLGAWFALKRLQSKSA